MSRRAGKPAVSQGPVPPVIKAATVSWLVAASLLAIAGTSFVVSSRTQHQDGAGLLALGVLVLGLAAATAFCVLRMRAGKRSGRESLTTIGLIGIPLLFRGPSLIAVGVVLLACVALLWLPGSMRFFQARDPKVRKPRPWHRR